MSGSGGPAGEPEGCHRRVAGYTAEDREYRRITIALFLAGLATFATIYCPQPLLPTLSADFGKTPAQAALSISLTTIFLGASLLVLGPVSDAIGRTPVMLGSLLASSLVCIGVAWAPTWPLLLALRALLGISVAGLPAVAVAYLREEIHPGWASRATGLYIGGTALGGMAGRLVSGALTDLVGWRVAITGIGVLSLGCSLTVRALLPASRRFAAHRLDAAGWRSAVRRGSRDPVMAALMVIGFVSMGVFVAVFNVIGYRLQGLPYRLSPGVAGIVYLVYILGSVSSARAGRAADRTGPARLVALGLAIMLAGVLVGWARPLWLLVAGIALVTIGFFAAHGVASGWVAAHASERQLGTGQWASLYLFFYYLGSSLAGTSAGWAWFHDGWRGLVTLTCSMLLFALVVVAMAGQRHNPGLDGGKL